MKDSHMETSDALDFLFINGDGIGSEVINSCKVVLKAASEKFNLPMQFRHTVAGGEAYDNTNMPLPAEARRNISTARAVIMGPTGGEKWADVPDDKNPRFTKEKLCQSFNFNQTVIPLFNPKTYSRNSSFMAIVKDQLGGYLRGRKGTRRTVDNMEKSYDIEEYSTFEVKQICLRGLALADELAKGKDGKILLIDCAAYLDTSKLWRKTFLSFQDEYPNLSFETMELSRGIPSIIQGKLDHQVLLTTNFFGDILYRSYAGRLKSPYMFASGSLDSFNNGLYTPLHGPCEHLKDTDRANPTAAITSGAMALYFTYHQKTAAYAIKKALYLTNKELPDDTSCKAFTEKVLYYLDKEPINT